MAEQAKLNKGLNVREGARSSSPECLMLATPLRDDYSTDDDMLRRSVRTVKTNYRESNRKDYPEITKIALTDINNGSEFKGEQSYFYQSIHFQKIDEEILLEDKSICECLHYLFKFSSSRFFNEEKCTWKGERIVDLLDGEMKTKGFLWLVENDNIDWKTASPNKKSEIEELHVKLLGKGTLCRSNDSVLNVALKTKALYDEVSSQNVVNSLEERCLRHKIVTSCIESIATFISPIHYLRNGMCARDFEFYVPHDLVSDKSPLIPDGREVVIQNRPDGVFTFPYSTTLNKKAHSDELWLIAVEVYGPNSEKEVDHHRFSPCPISGKHGFSPVFKPQPLYPQNEDSFVKNPNSDRTTKYQTFGSPGATSSPISSKDNKGRRNVSSPRNYLPPKTLTDSLLNSTYIDDIRNYITEALPLQCRSSHCRDKMAGQHIQQLLAVAKQITSEQGSFFEEGTIEVLGLFVVNEYVYFSRLDIEKKLTYFFSGAPYKVGIPNHANHAAYALFEIKKKTKAFRELNMPSASFSNFRLDLTFAKHRLALLIFLEKYMLAFFNTKL